MDMTRLAARHLSRSMPWTCTRCALRTSLRQWQTTISTARRSIQTTHRTGQNAAFSYDQVRAQYKQRNQNTIYYTLSIILGTVALSYGSVPMYKMICQTTGWGGQPIKHTDDTLTSDGHSSRLVPVTTAPRIRITFAGSTSDMLPWKFTPQQREVRVLPGETALAFYTATNLSKEEDIIGVATYSVTPAQAAPYFSKIQCFCFEEQRLNRGETVDMPVFFYIDPEFTKDITMRQIETITLNYTFFKARYDKDGHLSPVPLGR